MGESMFTEFTLRRLFSPRKTSSMVSFEALVLYYVHIFLQVTMEDHNIL